MVRNATLVITCVLVVLSVQAELEEIDVKDLTVRLVEFPEPKAYRCSKGHVFKETESICQNEANCRPICWDCVYEAVESLSTVKEMK